MLNRATYPGGYNESMYSGAQYVTTMDNGAGTSREGPSGSIIRLAREAHASNGIAFAVMAVRMALFAEARFTFQALTDGHTFGDQSLGLLEHPWPNADSGELLSRIQQDGSLGNAFIRKAVPVDGGDPELVQLTPETVTIVSEQAVDDMGRTWRRPVGYMEAIPGRREPQIYTTEEVSHFSPVPDPHARWRGMSWLTPILREVRADQALTQYKEFHLDNGAMPGLVVKYSMKLSDPTVDTLRKRMRARYGGPENAGNVLILDQGADATVAGSTLAELQADAVTKAGERRVCAAGGPGMLVICGFEQGDYQTAIRELADLWARPQWRMCCAALEHLVPTSAQVDPVRLWYDVSGIAALREGELQRAQAYLVKAQGLSSTIMAGMTRISAIAAADTGDLALLKPDPNAPPPGVAGRETATEHLGPGQQQVSMGVQGGASPQPPTGGPAGVGAGRPPQAGRPQQLPGVGRPNLPSALPAATGAGVPALPGGARGSVNGTRRHRLPDDDWWVREDPEDEE
jgi:hypothetical protein